MVGGSNVGDTSHVTLWRAGRIMDFGTVNGASSEATAVNNRGPVGGWNTATGINDSGVICGTSGNTDGSAIQAVLWNAWQYGHSAR